MYRKSTCLDFSPPDIFGVPSILCTRKIKSCINFVHTTENSGTNLQILYLIQLYVPFFVKSSKKSNYFRRLLKSTFRGSLINTIIYSKKNIVLFILVLWTLTKKKSCYTRNMICNFIIEYHANQSIVFSKKYVFLQGFC